LLRRLGKGKNMKKNRYGFTAIELMITIAIIAIISFFSTPYLIRYRNSSQLRGGTFGLKADLGRARSLAIRDRSDVLVQLSSGSYTIGALNPIALPSGVQINLAATDLDSDNITFSSKGLPKNSINDTGTIVLENASGESRSISINRLGRIIIQ
jgi:prepilin-type N-terminal cleavage/methylation domain-containing protein